MAMTYFQFISFIHHLSTSVYKKHLNALNSISEYSREVILLNMLIWV